MASYTYQCNTVSCPELGKVATVRKSMSDDTVPECPQCNQPMGRVFTTTTNFSLKGRGWTGSNIAGRG